MTRYGNQLNKFLSTAFIPSSQPKCIAYNTKEIYINYALLANESKLYKALMVKYCLNIFLNNVKLSLQEFILVTL